MKEGSVEISSSLSLIFLNMLFSSSAFILNLFEYFLLLLVAGSIHGTVGHLLVKPVGNLKFTTNKYFVMNEDLF